MYLRRNVESINYQYTTTHHYYHWMMVVLHSKGIKCICDKKGRSKSLIMNEKTFEHVSTNNVLRSKSFGFHITSQIIIIMAYMRSIPSSHSTFIVNHTILRKCRFLNWFDVNTWLVCFDRRIRLKSSLMFPVPHTGQVKFSF